MSAASDIAAALIALESLLHEHGVERAGSALLVRLLNAIDKAGPNAAILAATMATLLEHRALERERMP